MVYVLAQKPGSPDWHGLFDVQAPDWEAELVIDEGPSIGGGGLLGRTVAGSKVWLHMSSQLWMYDGIKNRARRVCSDSKLGSVIGVVASPDESLLALVSEWPPVPYLEGTPREVPIRVLEPGTGKVHTLTSGGGFHNPVGWSATVPRRLYFRNAAGELWRLDIPKELP